MRAVSAAAAILIVLLVLVTLASTALLAAVVRLSARRSVTTGTAAEAMGGAVRAAATELVTALVAGRDPGEVERATERLTALLDLDPAQLRSAARTRRRS